MKLKTFARSNSFIHISGLSVLDEKLGKIPCSFEASSFYCLQRFSTFKLWKKSKTQIMKKFTNNLQNGT